MANIVAIVGRPNVGKSTLFNRLTESRQAIVDEASGVTRDRHYGKVDWNGKEFTLIDTGGYIKGSDDIFEEEIRKQVMIAIEEADLLVFVVDVTLGITDLDQEVANVLRRTNKKVILVSNKVDNTARIPDSSVFYGLGISDDIYNVSSVSGSGTGELLDEIVNNLEDKEIEEEEDLLKLAIVGRPNVGKSSLLNALIGKERNIVTNIAGTTRDAISTRYTAFGFDMKLVDTAGLRKRGKVNEDLEFYSTMRTIRAIENADVCLLMIEASEGIMSQDMNILSLIIKNKKGLVILVNKWDLIEKETNTAKEFEKVIKQRLAPFTDVPIIFTSVTNNKQRIFKALEEVVKVYENRKRKVSTSKLNDVMLEIINQNPPPAVKGKYIKIKFVNQLPTYTPTFAFYCNLPQYIKDPYKRFLENKLRENFDFKGVPLQLFMRKK
ncbi:MAG: ribosome biogenesis GTPase Der [Flavobacteriales bacterium]|nr:ribosome biogenesis GTPase Der [Flavobacteriales bacterium]MCB9335464.1 ribosome biogenesis GTPase Der [Flavobacteriales bacterium]